MHSSGAAMASDPVLIAYGVKQATKAKRSIWNRIGKAYAHEEGAGLTLVLSALPRDGRIILLERNDADDARLEREAKNSPQAEVMIGERHD
jgi:hypothetical protein